MKPLALLSLLALAACSHPMLATNLVFDGDEAEANPVLSGKIGGATVTVDP